VPGALFCLALIIFWPALGGPYIWDDNAMLRAGSGSGGLRAIWTGGLVDYLPITSTVLWAGWHIWGNSPPAFRLLNVTTHAANAALIWWILRKLKCRGAWIAAGIFCVHPVCTATVAWIAEIKNTLSLSFALLTLFFYVSHVQRRGTNPQNPTPEAGWPGWLAAWVGRDYVLALLSFVLALLSKISVVMLPFILVALESWGRERVPSGNHGRTPAAVGTGRDGPVRRAGIALMWISPFFLLSILLGLVNVWFQKHHAMAAAAASHPEPMITRLLSGGYALWFYLGKAFLPVNLMPIYSRWEINPKSWLDWVPGVLWVLLLGSCWGLSQLNGLRLRQLFRVAFWGLGFFSITLVPVLGLLQISYFYISPVADHFQYLPMVGIIAGVAIVLAELTGDARGGAVRVAVAGAVIALLSCASWRRADLFGHPERLWRDNLARNPQAAMAWTNLGDVVAAEGRLEEAYEAYSKSLALDPGNLAVRAIFGRLLVEMGRLDEAIAQYREIIRFLPSDANAHNNLGVTLARKKLFDQAIGEFKTALEFAPDFAEARKNLGGAYYSVGRYDAAIEELKRVLRINPSFPIAEQLLAEAERRKNQR
jgi:Tfp pilus assembly protein PilF